MKIKTLSAYCKQYEESIAHPEQFWSNIAEEFQWQQKWDKILEWDFDKVDVSWFKNGKLNITENLLDRHLSHLGNDPAIIWEPNQPNEAHQILTYQDLFSKVCRFANALKSLGVEKGDRVVIYLPMIPESAVAMLACARIGAVHSVVFAGFSANALADRIQDCKAKIVITSDGNYRGEKRIPVKSVVDEALQRPNSVENVIVYKRTGEKVSMENGRDRWWEDLISSQSDFCPAEKLDSEDLLFILYTSGSTGKPKGIVHTCGGYMVYTKYTFENVFQYDVGDVYWCTADVGWITGHSYIIYGPLLTGATTLMFEGIPTFPHTGRFWEIIDKHQVNQFYTAPTAIRSLQTYGLDPLSPYQLDSLKVIGSVGEPINEEAWHWYHKNIGKEKCPLVDTWWQTETGGIMISPLAGITPNKPAHASLPLPGIQPILVDSKGNELEGPNVEGNLCIKFPWPSMLRTTYGDHDRCKEVYFKSYNGLYFTGDSAKRDHDGYFRILGRVDDIINVSGHRIGTAEVENAINEHVKVIESAVVGYPHDIKGQGICAFVIYHGDIDRKSLIGEIRNTVSLLIGPIAKPDKIILISGLPKTRSGKIMRRVLRKIANGEADQLGDTSTLLNPEVINEIINVFDDLD